MDLNKTIQRILGILNTTREKGRAVLDTIQDMRDSFDLLSSIRYDDDETIAETVSAEKAVLVSKQVRKIRRKLT
jgi:hypothetical protein